MAILALWGGTWLVKGTGRLNHEDRRQTPLDLALFSFWFISTPVMVRCFSFSHDDDDG